MNDERSPSPVLDSAAARTQALRPRRPGGSYVLSDSHRTEPNEPPLPLPSQSTRATLAGYELLRQLGRGGMGVVWLARNLRTQQRVALKMIHAGGAAGPTEVERFLNEAQAGARLQHPHIVRVLHFGVENERPFFTMELLFGGTLRDRLRRGPLTPRDSARIIAQAARAIQYAHEHKVLHRDLTPSNLLLAASDWQANEQEPVVAADSDPHGVFATPDGELSVKVCDFGLARLQDATTQLTRTGEQIGTPSYMAPEQVAGASSRVDERTDVYGLGAVLYACLTGRPPFQAATAVETLLQSRTTDPVPVRTLVPSVPRSLEAVCLKCLEKDSRRRYSSAAELADDLERWLTGVPVRARPAGPVERALKWARRHALVASLGAAAAVALLAGVIVSSAFAVAARREAKTAHTAKTFAQEAAERADAEKGRADANATEARTALRRATDQLDLTERALYVGQLAHAQREFYEGNAARAIEILTLCKPTLRHLEHHLLWTRFTSLRMFPEASGGVFCAAYSLDGKRLALGTGTGVVKVLDAERGVELLRFKGHEQTVTAVAFTPDGERLATASGDVLAGLRQDSAGVIKLWHVADGRELVAIEQLSCSIFSLAMSPDGKRLASAGADRKIHLWDTETGNAIRTLEGHTRPVSSVDFSSNGKRLLSGSYDQTIRQWDAETGKHLKTYQGHLDNVYAVRYSPDGKRFLSAGHDRVLAVWHLENDKPQFVKLGPVDGFRSAVFSRDGSRIAAGRADSDVMVLESARGQELFRLKGHALPVFAVAFRGDGERIVSASADPFRATRPGEVREWHARRGQLELVLRGHNERVKAVTFSPDSRIVLSACCDRTIKLRDAEYGQEIATFGMNNAAIHSAAFRPDGKRIVSGHADGVVKVWDVAAGKELLSFVASALDVDGVTYSPDGKRILTGGRDGHAAWWDAETGRKLFALPRQRSVQSVAMSRDGKRLLTATGGVNWSHSIPGEVCLWDAATGRLLRRLKGHDDGIHAAAFNPDGDRIVTGSRDRTARVWDATTGKLLRTLTGHALPITAVAFGPDGKRILTGGGDYLHSARHGEVKLWDAERGEELLSLTGHREAVSGVAFAPDGRRIATGSWDRTVRIWDAHRRHQVPAR